MSNPTTKVPSRLLPYGGDDKFYLPYPEATADTFVNGEMLGVDPSTGYGAHFDDSKPLVFRGLNPEPTRIIATDAPTPIFLMAQRPRLFSMPLATGTISRGYQLGAPVFAVNSGAVQVGSASLANANLVGYFFDIEAPDPETLTGASSIWISPEPNGPRLEKTGRVLTAPASGGHTYGAEALNALIEVPATAAQTITLPAISQTTSGDTITVVNTGGADVVTIAAQSGDDINGSATYAMTGAAYAVARLISDGSQWLVI